MRKFGNELITGIAVFIAIGVALFFWAKTSDYKVETYSLKTCFSEASGVKENSMVTLAGVEVGRVQKSILFILRMRRKWRWYCRWIKKRK